MMTIKRRQYRSRAMESLMEEFPLNACHLNLEWITTTAECTEYKNTRSSDLEEILSLSHLPVTVNVIIYYYIIFLSCYGGMHACCCRYADT